MCVCGVRPFFAYICLSRTLLVTAGGGAGSNGAHNDNGDGALGGGALGAEGAMGALQELEALGMNREQIMAMLGINSIEDLEAVQVSGPLVCVCVCVHVCGLKGVFMIVLLTTLALPNAAYGRRE